MGAACGKEVSTNDSAERPKSTYWSKSMPPGWFAQESRFVPRNIQGADEDDGWLLTYGESQDGIRVSLRKKADLVVAKVYDEQHVDTHGRASNAPGSGSELWIIDAKTMWKGPSSVVCKLKLPQRVPYG